MLTKGTRQFNTCVREPLLDAFRALARRRGETVRSVLERVLEREIAGGTRGTRPRRREM